MVTYNTRTIVQPLIGDILRLMSDLKIHIVALQDTGLLFTTAEGKAAHGNYHIEQYKFGEGKADTLAFLIDEGIKNHIIKEQKVVTNEKARAMMIILPN